MITHRVLLAVATATSAFAWQCQPNSSQATAVEQGCRTQLWDVGPLDFTNNFTAGAPYLNVISKTEVYDGIAVNRTYSHHPLVRCSTRSAADTQMLALPSTNGTTIALIHTSATVDEDSMGQQIWAAMSYDGGFTWTPSAEIIASALLPNQTSVGPRTDLQSLSDGQEENFLYWCNRSVIQRAWGCEAIIQSPATQIVYAVAGSSDYYCNNGSLANDVGAESHRGGRTLNSSISVVEDVSLDRSISPLENPPGIPAGCIKTSSRRTLFSTRPCMGPNTAWPTAMR